MTNLHDGGTIKGLISESRIKGTFMIKKIRLKNTPVYYDFQRKNVRNINLRIKSDMTVSVSAGSGVPDSAVEEFLQSKADMILSALKRFSAADNKINGEKDSFSLYLFGRKCRTEFIVSDKNEAITDYENTAVTFYLKPPVDAVRKQKLIDGWCRQQAEAVITRFCVEIYPLFERRGIAYPAIRFRKMTSQWGNCRPKQGILTFNTMLSQVPPPCVKYVVAHELVHFLHADHSKRFYEELEKIIPDRKSREHELKEYGILLGKRIR